NTSQLTDVGCTMRLLRRSAYAHLRPHFTVKGSHFGPEMMVLSFLLGLRTIQIPVNYRRRVGDSSVTGSTAKAIQVGLQMIAIISRYRVSGRQVARVPMRDKWGVEIAGERVAGVEIGR